MKKPLVFITAGDPLGIGPEVTVRALQNAHVQRSCSPIVIGEPTSLLRAGWTDKLSGLIALESTEKLPTKHVPSRVGGMLSFQAVKLGIKLATQHHAPLVTAPISKQSWTLAEVPFTGHTELLRHTLKTDGLMMFVSGNLRCALVTEHFALAHLPLTKIRVEQTAKLFKQALTQLGLETPRIGLCAVNPHASDNGKFGAEENEILLPALKTLRRQRVHIDGPLPTDTAWIKHTQGQYDGLLCTYHDQALLGLKLAAKQPIVHVTAGLAFVRTSPAHGTAFDIAGRHKADSKSMESAILFAIQ